MSFVWQKRRKAKFHIATDKGTLCKYENGGSGHRLTERSNRAPDNREFCKTCQNLIGKSETTKKKKKAYNKGFYQSWEWKKARFETIKRYGPVCMCCGSEYRIVVDHIKPRSKYPAMELDLDNLQILCSECNMGKNNDDETDFRPDGPTNADLAELELVRDAEERIH